MGTLNAATAALNRQAISPQVVSDCTAERSRAQVAQNIYIYIHICVCGPGNIYLYNMQTFPYINMMYSYIDVYPLFHFFIRLREEAAASPSAPAERVLKQVPLTFARRADRETTGDAGPGDHVAGELHSQDSEPAQPESQEEELNIGQMMPTLSLRAHEPPSLAVQVHDPAGGINSATHAAAYKRLQRFMRNQRNTELTGMNTLWNGGLAERNRLLQRWVSEGENAERIEASLSFEMEARNKESEMQEELTIDQMRQAGIPENLDWASKRSKICYDSLTDIFFGLLLNVFVCVGLI